MKKNSFIFWLLLLTNIAFPGDFQAEVYETGKKEPVYIEKVKGFSEGYTYYTFVPLLDVRNEHMHIYQVDFKHISSIQFEDDTPVHFSYIKNYWTEEDDDFMKVTVTSVHGLTKEWYIKAGTSKDRDTFYGEANQGGLQTDIQIPLDKIQKIVFKNIKKTTCPICYGKKKLHLLQAEIHTSKGGKKFILESVKGFAHHAMGILYSSEVELIPQPLDYSTVFKTDIKHIRTIEFTQKSLIDVIMEENGRISRQYFIEVFITPEEGEKTRWYMQTGTSFHIYPSFYGTEVKGGLLCYMPVRIEYINKISLVEKQIERCPYCGKEFSAGK